MAAAGLVGRDDKKGEERRGGGLGANCRFSHYRVRLSTLCAQNFYCGAFCPPRILLQQITQRDLVLSQLRWLRSSYSMSSTTAGTTVQHSFVLVDINIISPLYREVFWEHYQQKNCFLNSLTKKVRVHKARYIFPKGFNTRNTDGSNSLSPPSFFHTL